MAASIDGIFENSLQNAILSCKVLVVGAGGIGCELLKNLVLTGFYDIELIDLDTIDLSNLNRQFLFRKEHIGKSKSMVARESALKFNHRANIVSHHGSIMSPEYDTDYFKKFKMVLNALDNNAARNHVNRMCLAANVPLVESGTAGYLGQVSVINKNQSECYECLPKPAAKTFPGCTIRNTPSELIHCIVWAKHLFNQLFGEADADQDVSPDTADPEQTGSETGQASLKADNGNARVNTREWVKSHNYNASKILSKVFKDDIAYLLSMKNLWKSRKAPKPLTQNTIDNHVDICGFKIGSPTTTTMLPDQQVPVDEVACVEGFVTALDACVHMLRGDNNLTWDKDEEDFLDFVVHAANLRAHIFHIPMKSKFDIKSMAGNIIPAIATTNAVIAGLIVMEALKIVDNQLDKCKQVYLCQLPSDRGKLLQYCPLDPPNPKCYVCSDKPEIAVKLNCKTMTLQTLQDKVLKTALGMVAPDVEIDDGKGTIILSSEPGETDQNLPKHLNDFHISNNTILKCDDFLQVLNINVNIVHIEKLKEDAEFEIIGDLSKLTTSAQTKDEVSPDNEQDESEGECTMIDDDIVVRKRKASVDSEIGGVVEKMVKQN